MTLEAAHFGRNPSAAERPFVRFATATVRRACLGLRGDSMMSVRPLSRLTPALALLLFALPASAAETKGFVVSWFHTAGYADKDSCPRGINPDNNQMWARDLIGLGFTPAEAEKVIV